jgi:hypothetical protein
VDSVGGCANLAGPEMDSEYEAELFEMADDWVNLAAVGDRTDDVLGELDDAVFPSSFLLPPLRLSFCPAT